MESSAGSFDGGFEIFKHLQGLCAEIVFANNVAGCIERDLASDENDGAASHAGDMRIPRGLGHGDGIQQLEVGMVRHLFCSSLQDFVDIVDHAVGLRFADGYEAIQPRMLGRSRFTDLASTDSGSDALIRPID